MSDHGNRKAWERIQQNPEYHDAYQKWCGRQFYFYKFTGVFYVGEDVPLNEYGRKYAEDLFGIMVTERAEKQNKEYQEELRETISEVETMGLLEPYCFTLLKTIIDTTIWRLKYLCACNEANYQPEIMPRNDTLEFSKGNFIEEFQKCLNTSILSVWVNLIDAAKPHTPFQDGFWPLNPLSDYENVRQYDLMNQGAAAAFVELKDNGEILVKIDPKMPDKLISERMKLIVEAVREKHGIKKAVGSGTLKGARRGMLGVPDELAEAMEKDFRKHPSSAYITRKYYDALSTEKDNPLTYYVNTTGYDKADITESRIYRKIYRWSKTLNMM